MTTTNYNQYSQQPQMQVENSRNNSFHKDTDFGPWKTNDQQDQPIQHLHYQFEEGASCTMNSNNNANIKNNFPQLQLQQSCNQSYQPLSQQKHDRYKSNEKYAHQNQFSNNIQQFKNLSNTNSYSGQFLQSLPNNQYGKDQTSSQIGSQERIPKIHNNNNIQISSLNHKKLVPIIQQVQSRAKARQTLQVHIIGQKQSQQASVQVTPQPPEKPNNELGAPFIHKYLDGFYTQREQGHNSSCSNNNNNNNDISVDNNGNKVNKNNNSNTNNRGSNNSGNNDSNSTANESSRLSRKSNFFSNNSKEPIPSPRTSLNNRQLIKEYYKQFNEQLLSKINDNKNFSPQAKDLPYSQRANQMRRKHKLLQSLHNSNRAEKQYFDPKEDNEKLKNLLNITFDNCKQFKVILNSNQENTLSHYLLNENLHTSLTGNAAEKKEKQAEQQANSNNMIMIQNICNLNLQFFKEGDSQSQNYKQRPIKTVKSQCNSRCNKCNYDIPNTYSCNNNVNSCNNNAQIATSIFKNTTNCNGSETMNPGTCKSQSAKQALSIVYLNSSCLETNSATTNNNTSVLNNTIHLKKKQKKKDDNVQLRKQQFQNENGQFLNQTLNNLYQPKRKLYNNVGNADEEQKKNAIFQLSSFRNGNLKLINL